MPRPLLFRPRLYWIGSLRSLWLAFALIAVFARTIGADTYQEWKARVFSESEQADPAISGETALSPAGDGIPNILKYAFGVDPHVDGFYALPKLSTVNVTDPSSGVTTRYPVISYQKPKANPASDLSFVPEASVDLQTWMRGDATFDAPLVSNGEDSTAISIRALSAISTTPAFLRLRIIEGQTLPDDWQQTHFGGTGVDPNDDADGDGKSNFYEFLHGTDPNDYYNGRQPTLSIVEGDNQQGEPNSFLALRFAVKVVDAAGNPLANAPVAFSVTDGGGSLASAPGETTSSSQTVRADSLGIASAFFKQPSESGVTSHITVSARTAQVVFTSLSIDSAVFGLSVDPEAINAVVNTGQFSLRSLTLRNSSDKSRQFKTSFETSYAIHLSYKDSDQADGPIYVWNDISGTGKRLNAVSHADEATEAIDLSFAFPYFDDVYERIYVSSNGFITVGEEAQQYQNYALPNHNMPRNEIAPFHTDMDLGPDGEVYYQDFGDRVVVQFNNAARYGVDAKATFQVVLRRDGGIFFYYKDLSGPVDDVTVGLQDFARDRGLTVAYQRPYLKNNLAVQVIVDVQNITNAVEKIAWQDSDQPGGPEFVWNDITQTGVHLDALSNFDDGAQKFDFSFAFPYFGESLSTVYVSSNGFVTLGSPSNDYLNYTFPDPLAPSNDIAAFQNNLDLNASGDVYCQDFGDRVVIQYNNAARYAGDGFATFQIVLQKDGTILFYYRDLVGKTDGASVGVQNYYGDKGITIVDRQPYLKNNLAVRITFASPWLMVAPTEGTLGPGESIALDLTLDARLIASPGTLHGRLHLTSDSPDDPSLVVPIAMEVNLGPKVTLNLVDHGAVFVDGDAVPMKAAAVDFYGVDRVEFFDGATKIGESTASDFAFTWANPTPGVHLISARAIDRLGAAGVSAPLSVELQADTNHNGIGDAWEMAHFGNLDQTGEGDFDNDGWNNLAEFRAGTDPTHFDDADGDGVGDGTEVNVYHTDPQMADTDHDGMPDGYEIVHSLDPTHNDSGVDEDGDGLTNLEEMTLGTEPRVRDTDADGTPDGEDFWPTSKVFRGPRVPSWSYVAMIQHPTNQVLNNNNLFAYRYETVPINIQKTYVAANTTPDFGGIPIAFGGGLPPTGLGGARLRYGQVVPYGLNDSKQVLGLCFGFYELNPDSGNTYPPENGYGPYFFVGDDGHFWNHEIYDHYVLWTDGAVQDIGVYTVNELALNNQGAVLLSIGQLGQEHVLIWQNGVASDLGFGRGHALNNSGIIVGDYNHAAGWWRGAGFESLPDFGVIDSSALSINDAQEIAGWSSVPPTWNRHGVAWRDTESLDLGIASGGDGHSAAWSINQKSQMVGESDGVGGVIWENGRIRTFTEAISDFNWYITRPYFINDHGLALADALHYRFPPNPGYYYERALLVPAEIMVDGNRDGQMSTKDGLVHDRDVTTQDRPYRFWLNDDDDTEVEIGEGGVPGDPEEVDKVPATRPDSSLHQIVSKRNLEDFSRLWIYLGGLHELIASGEVQVGLRWVNVASGTNPAINIYPSADEEGGDGYLKDDAAAAAQIQNPIYNNAVSDIGNIQTITPNVLFIFKKDYWNNFNADHPKKCFLFEGVSEGKGRLELVFFDKSFNEIAHGGGTWLELKNIKRMYQRIEGATEHAWPSVHFDPDPDEGTTNLVVFVHGWRMSPDGAGNYAETMFKRMWHQGFLGRFAAYHWDTYWFEGYADWLPYAGQVVDAYLSHFNDSEFVAWNSGAKLKEYVNATHFANKSVIAHSMGNIVAGEALKEGMLVSNYALLNAAVPASCYDDDELRIRQTVPSEQHAGPFTFTVWDSPTPDEDNDLDTRAVAYRGTLSGIGGKTNLINFYLANDYATSFAWEINNDQAKPPLRLNGQSNASFAGNYEYDPNGAAGKKLWKFNNIDEFPNVYMDETIKPEAMAYACRTWGKAVGAWGATQGAIPAGNSVSLSEGTFGGGFQEDHNAEFGWSIQRLRPFVGRLMTELDLNPLQ